MASQTNWFDFESAPYYLLSQELLRSGQGASYGQQELLLYLIACALAVAFSWELSDCWTIEAVQCRAEEQTEVQSHGGKAHAPDMKKEKAFLQSCPLSGGLFTSSSFL